MANLYQKFDFFNEFELLEPTFYTYDEIWTNLGNIRIPQQHKIS